MLFPPRAHSYGRHRVCVLCRSHTRHPTVRVRAIANPPQLAPPRPTTHLSIYLSTQYLPTQAFTPSHLHTSTQPPNPPHAVLAASQAKAYSLLSQNTRGIAESLPMKSRSQKSNHGPLPPTTSSAQRSKMLHMHPRFASAQRE